MKEITIYVPTDPKVELPEPGMLVYATIKVEAIKFMVVASIDDDTGKWIEHLEETNNLDVIEWLKPVTISEEEIIKIMYRNGFTNEVRVTRVARAITTLMKGDSN